MGRWCSTCPWRKEGHSLWRRRQAVRKYVSCCGLLLLIVLHTQDLFRFHRWCFGRGTWILRGRKANRTRPTDSKGWLQLRSLFRKCARKLDFGHSYSGCLYICAPKKASFCPTHSPSNYTARRREEGNTSSSCQFDITYQHLGHNTRTRLRKGCLSNLLDRELVGNSVSSVTVINWLLFQAETTEQSPQNMGWWCVCIAYRR